MTGTLLIARGLPGSGKSTWAKAWVALDPTHRTRLNRDDLRASLHGGFHGYETEQQVTQVQHLSAEAFLKRGIDVITDDTNLVAKYVKEWLTLAEKVGAEVEWHDEFLDVSLDECISRDEKRTVGYVGNKVIRDMHTRFLSRGRLKRPELAAEALAATKPYDGTPGAPKAILVDLDGTIATNTGHRSFFDWSKVGDDDPVPEVIDIVHWAESSGITPIFVSGRDAVCYKETYDWIAEHVYNIAPWEVKLLSNQFLTLFMREEGDQRQDSIVKLEIFDREIRDNYDVVFCLDDRNQVVKAYRGIGLRVLQVQDGDF